VQQDVLSFKQSGVVVVMGDFNYRVGELPNVIVNPETLEERSWRRSSLDNLWTSAGRKLLNSLNGVGLVLLNGVLSPAQLTSHQRIGSSMIDMVWIQSEEMEIVRDLQVWDSIVDHSLVTVDLAIQAPQDQGSNAYLASTVPRFEFDSTEHWRRSDRGNSSFWDEFRMCSNNEMKQWLESPLMDTLNISGQDLSVHQDVCEKVWSSWLTYTNSAALEGLGKDKPPVSKPKAARQSSGWLINATKVAILGIA